MSEPATQPQAHPLPIRFSDVPDLPVHYINAMNLRLGVDGFFFTLGTTLPPEVATPEDLDALTHLAAQPVFRFAVAGVTMKQFLDLMNRQYELWQRTLETAGLIPSSQNEQNIEEETDGR